MRALLAATTAAIALASGLSPPAQAVLMLSANVNGTVISCADQAACDTNLAVGQLAIADQTINGVEFLGSAQTQVIGTTNSLNTSSFQFINTNATPATVTVAVSGINFQGPVATFSDSGSGTWQSAGGSTIDLSYFAANNNAQGANNPTDLPGTMLDNFSNTAVGATDSFSHNFAGVFVDPDLYSMSLGTTGTLVAGGSLVGRSQAIVTAQVASEPRSLGILGLGLAGTGFLLRRKRRQDRPSLSELAAA